MSEHGVADSSRGPLFCWRRPDIWAIWAKWADGAAAAAMCLQVSAK